MKNLLPVILLIAVVSPLAAAGQGSAPVPILPDSLHWVSPANIPGLQVAWVLGAEQQAGPYVLRVKLDKGARIPPHTHPDERNTIVLMGTIYVGFGNTFDESKLVAIPSGAVYVAPAHVPHYIWAKDGAAMYQETGVGPTGTTMATQ